jgi:aldehyde:ferredoxin oxidoreductase
LQEGQRVPEADFPPGFNFTEPLQAIPNFDMVMIPGPNGKEVDVRGKTLDRDRCKNMLREYYRLRGWDEETGRPKDETLANLGLDDLAPLFSSECF